MARTTRRPPGLYKPPPQPFGPLTRALAARSPLCAAAETLAAPSPLTFAVAASPPTRSRLGVVQGGEEITRAACGHPRAPSRPGKLAGVASPPHRAARRRHRKRAVRAALDDSAALRSTFRCKSRMKSSPLARICGTPVRPPPLAADRRHPPSPACSRASATAGSGSDGPDQSPPPLAQQLPPAVGSRSKGLD
jgi:hypothetical protein